MKTPHAGAITPRREAKIRQALLYRQKDLTLALCNIHDPHNVSAIFRSCDAFGVPEAHLYYTDTAFPSLGAKSSASARKWVKTIRHRQLESLAAALRGKNMRLLAANCNPDARPIYEFDLTLPTAFMMGNERRGVDAEIMGISDAEVYIPMYGMIQSFNVSVAAALLLAEASRQRKDAGLYGRPTYSEQEFAALYAEWICK